jgi:hypothetical protein
MLESSPLRSQIADAARSRHLAQRTTFGAPLPPCKTRHSTAVTTSRVDFRKMPEIIKKDELGFESGV